MYIDAMESAGEMTGSIFGREKSGRQGIMGAQDKTEKVLRNIHVLFSKAEPYQGSKQKVIVDKNEVMDLLKELNGCMYDMMEEHELTKRSRDAAEREARKKQDDLIFEASRNAEDIYAASIMYTDNALSKIGELMKQAASDMEQVYRELDRQMKKERQEVKSNQLDLKAQLQELIDTQKYLRLIEDENRRLVKEKEKHQENGRDMAEKSPYAGIKPEIRINKEYFAQAGIPFSGEEEKESEAERDSEAETDLKRTAELSRELDEDYFRWKEGKEGGAEKKDKGFSLFGRKFNK